MTWPAPQLGLVIRYSYLWTSESRSGREEGSKDRPCAIVLAVGAAQERTRVVVLPVTHAAPQPPDEGIEIPPAVKARLGLEHACSWIIVSEGNDFIWPGPDLRPLPGEGLQSVVYGFLPPRLFHAVRNRFLARARTGQAGTTRRTE